MSLFHTKLQLVNSTAYRHAPVLRVTDLELSVSAALNQAREATSVQSVETQCNLPRLEFFDTCVGPRPACEVAIELGRKCHAIGKPQFEACRAASSNRSPSGRLRLLRYGGFEMNRASSTIMARRLADPAPEGVIERADLGVAERKGDFRQRQSLVFQKI